MMGAIQLTDEIRKKLVFIEKKLILEEQIEI